MGAVKIFLPRKFLPGENLFFLVAISIFLMGLINVFYFEVFHSVGRRDVAGRSRARREEGY